MSKVLISFLGTSQEDIRAYKPATYRFADGWQMESTFIAGVLKSYYHIDRMILIGTVKSMWENVYHTFIEQPDPSVTQTLQKHCTHANAQSELYLPCKEQVEQALGNGSKVLLIQYGLTEEEIRYNESAILGLEKWLDDGDELYIDITHSFRSLPLFLMNTLIYLKTVSKKQIRIVHISYGMLDVSRELGYTPIVELNSLLQTHDWISGAYSFMEFGNAYRIAHLLEDGYQELANKLKNFSDVKNLNYLDALEKQVIELRSLRKRSMPAIARMVVPMVTDEFLSYFDGFHGHAQFQYRLAVWHFTKHNYASSYLVLVEAIISHVCEQKGWNEFDQTERDEAKSALFTDKSFYQLRKIYSQVNNIRKQIAHSVKGNKEYQEMIRKLAYHLDQLKTLLNY